MLKREIKQFLVKITDVVCSIFAQLLRTAQETIKSLQKFVPPDQKPYSIVSENVVGFVRACEGF